MVVLLLAHQGLLIVPHEGAARVALAGVPFALGVAGAQEVLVDAEPANFQFAVILVALISISDPNFGLQESIIGLAGVFIVVVVVVVMVVQLATVLLVIIFSL